MGAAMKTRASTWLKTYTLAVFFAALYLVGGALLDGKPPRAPDAGQATKHATAPQALRAGASAALAARGQR